MSCKMRALGVMIVCLKCRVTVFRVIFATACADWALFVPRLAAKRMLIKA